MNFFRYITKTFDKLSPSLKSCSTITIYETKFFLSDGEFPIPSTSSTGESLKHPALCECENGACAKSEMCDDVEKMDLVWIRATGVCTSNSLKKFLEKRGKLVSVNIIQGNV